MNSSNNHLLNDAPLEDDAPQEKLKSSSTDRNNLSKKPSRQLNAFLQSHNEKSLDDRAEDDTTLVTADETEITEEPDRLEAWKPLAATTVPFVPLNRRSQTTTTSSSTSTPVFTWRRRRKTAPSSVQKPQKEITFSDLQKHCILGEGQFGQVWLASYQDQPFALKIQSKYELALEDKIDFAVREKQALEQMDHPFIIHLLASFQDDHFLYLIMDLLQGGELWSLLHPVVGASAANSDTAAAAASTANNETVALPETQARFYAHCMADALAYIHTKHYVYRDVKPENVLIDGTGYPVLIDFGLAKRLEPGEKTYTMVGTLLPVGCARLRVYVFLLLFEKLLVLISSIYYSIPGTPSYCSPEVVMTHGHDTAADDWALGILIYEMLAGCNPFFYEGMDQRALFQSIAQDEYPVLPSTSISTEAADCLHQLLVKNPDNRLTSAQVLQHAWLADQDLTALRARRIAAPWIPGVTSHMDTSYFEDWSDLQDKMQQRYPLVEPRQAAMFADF